MVMAGGEICLLLPNVATFNDKICQMRRRAVPRCLFGPPDPSENKRLFEEFLQKERERAKKRWGVDLGDLEAAIEKASKKEKSEEESRIPQVSAELEERLSPAGLEDERRNSSCPAPPLRRSAICRKPCSKFQKRVRVSGNLKRQTHLTDFWRARKSVSFVFGKTKSRTISLQSLKDLLEQPQPPKMD